MEDKKAFLVYKNMGAHVKKLPDAEAGKLFKALFDYSSGNSVCAYLTPEADMLFGIMCDHIKIDDEKWNVVRERRSSAGRKGAESRWQTMANDGNAIRAKANDGKNGGNGNGNGDGNGNGNGKGNGNGDGKSEEPPPPPAPAPPQLDNTIKRPAGQYGHVMLTDAELDRLQLCRPNDWEAKIQRLDDYIEQSGKRYNNHLMVIIRWAEEDDKKAAERRAQDTSVHHEQERRETAEQYNSYFVDIFEEDT